jgi:hypothetical protein
MNKNKLTISQAVELSGISKPTFYKKYLNNKKLKKYKDDGLFYIKLSDFLYYFPNATLTEKLDLSDNEVKLKEENERLKTDINYLRKDIQERREREQQLLILLNRATLRLEHKPKPKLTKEQIIVICKKYQKSGESLQNTYDRIKHKL